MAETHPFGSGLHLTPHQRMHLENRIMLQGTKGMAEADVAAVRRTLTRTLNGIPGDVLFALDALRLLADQGNVVAADLFDHEIIRLGLSRKTYFGE